MRQPAHKHVDPVTRAQGAFERYDTDDTIRIAPRANIPLETGRFFLPEKPSGRAFRFELGSALRLLTASAPRSALRVQTRAALTPQAPQLAREPAISLADWQRWGTAFVQDAIVVVGGALERLVAAGRRLARSSLQWLSRPDRPSWVGALLLRLPPVSGWAYRGRWPGQSRVVRSRMSETEIAMLAAIARSWGCAPSDVVRVLVLQQCQSLAGDQLAMLKDSYPKRRSLNSASVDAAAPRRL